MGTQELQEEGFFMEQEQFGLCPVPGCNLESGKMQRRLLYLPLRRSPLLKELLPFPSQCPIPTQSVYSPSRSSFRSSRSIINFIFFGGALLESSSWPLAPPGELGAPAPAPAPLAVFPFLFLCPKHENQLRNPLEQRGKKLRKGMD